MDSRTLRSFVDKQNVSEQWVRIEKGARAGSIVRVIGSYTIPRYYYSLKLHLSFSPLKEQTIDLWSDTVEWLPHYSGPPVWTFVKKKKDSIPPKLDTFGNELKVGDIVVFHHTGNLRYGTITRFTEKTTYIRNIPLSDKEQSYERQVLDTARNVSLLNQDIMDHLVVAQLTHGGN